MLRGLAESKSDGIIQISTGGGAFASGSSLKGMALGAIAIAEHVHRAAERYPIYVALHTDHRLKDRLDKFVLPLVEETERRRASGRPNLFTAHMFDGSNLALQENIEISAKLLERFTKNEHLGLEYNNVYTPWKKSKSSLFFKMLLNCTQPWKALRKACRGGITTGKSREELLAAVVTTISKVWSPMRKARATSLTKPGA